MFNDLENVPKIKTKTRKNFSIANYKKVRILQARQSVPGSLENKVY